MDGWSWSLQGRVTNTEAITQQINYAFVGRGLSYESEGANRNVPVNFPSVAERDSVAGPAGTTNYSNATATAVGGTANMLTGTGNHASSDAPFGIESFRGFADAIEIHFRADLDARIALADDAFDDVGHRAADAFFNGDLTCIDSIRVHAAFRGRLPTEGPVAVGFQNAQLHRSGGWHNAEMVAHRHVDEGGYAEGLGVLLADAGSAFIFGVHGQGVAMDLPEGVPHFVDDARQGRIGSVAEIDRERIEDVSEEPRIAQQQDPAAIQVDSELGCMPCGKAMKR